MATTSVAIVPTPVDTSVTDMPFGHRYGDEIIRLGPEHIAALQAGQTIAIDVNEEYVIFVQLTEPTTAQTKLDEKV